MFNQKRSIFLCLLIGLIFTLLFYKKDIGVSFIIFTAAFLILLIYFLKKTGFLRKNKAWLFAVPITLLALNYSITTNEMLWFFNFWGIVLLSVIMTILLFSMGITEWARPQFFIKIMDALIMPVQYIIKPIQILNKDVTFFSKSKYRTVIAKVLIGLLISIPLLLILVALLASADMVFNQMLSFIPQVFGDWVNSQLFIDVIIQVVLVCITGIYAWCYFYNISKEKNEEMKADGKYDTVKGDNPKIDQVIIITVLVMINILYILFSIIQFSYLFGGGTGILPFNFTYAEYARRGFFELILVTIMNIGVILGSIYFAKKDSSISNNIIKGLLMLISFATFIMLYSSFFRMRLYEQNYGYTYLRIFVYFFLITETIMLAGTVWFIIKQNFNIIKMYIITFIICYTALNYINIDKMIAKNNIDRYFATGKVDVVYLNTLSLDSIPEMERLLQAKDTDVANNVREHFNNLKTGLNREISWVEYNYSWDKAKDIVNR